MSKLNLTQARFNMIEQQIRPWDVLDPRVLQLLAALPRDQFVPQAYASLAYADINIPLGHGECMMAPRMEGRLLQALDIRPSDRILEIGTGSGFFTALLASAGRHVYSVEIYSDLVQAAKKKLDQHNISNVTLETGDAAQGWGQHAPYDVIAITGSLPQLPETFLSHLTPGGRLFAIIGTAPVMEAVLMTRTVDNGCVRECLFETDMPPLVNARAPSRFVF